jgi:hypothetical protein
MHRRNAIKKNQKLNLKKKGGAWSLEHKRKGRVIEAAAA